MARPVQVSICLASAKQGRRRLWHNYVNSLSVARIAVRDALVLGLISCNYLPGEQCLSLSSSNGTLPIQNTTGLRARAAHHYTLPDGISKNTSRFPSADCK